MQSLNQIISKVYMKIIVLAFVLFMLAQLHIDYSFIDAIITTNYYALIFSSFIFALLALFCYRREFRVTKSDLIIVALAIFASIHNQDGFQTKEVVMSLSYIVLYFSLRLIRTRYSDFDRYATSAILILGIHQSISVLKQVFGFGMSKNYNFLVSGDFFNPGPCGIFLAGILVLGLTIIKREHNYKRESCIEHGQYYIAYTAILFVIMAIVPTLSRAGWVGAIGGVFTLYYKETKLWIIQFCSKHSLNVKIVTLIVALFCITSCVGVYMLKQDSANGRVFIWQNTIMALSKAPIMGVGVGGFSQSFTDAQAEYFESHDILTNDNANVSVVGVPGYPFNEILSITLALGVVGLISVLYVVYRRIFSCYNNYGAVVVSLIVASLFSYPFYIPLIAIIFIYAMASGKETPLKYNKRIIHVIILVPLMLLCYSLLGIRAEIAAKREWQEISMFYNMADYETVVKDSPPIFDQLYNNERYIFEYGHSLNKCGRYEESNRILLQGAGLTPDPMFWNVIGNNYVALVDYDKGAEAYLRAYYQCPNRLYPLFLLTKLYHAKGDFKMMEYYGAILLRKEPKVHSQAVEEMKREVLIMMENTSNL